MPKLRPDGIFPGDWVDSSAKLSHVVIFVGCFVLLECQNYLHDNNLGPCTSIHHIGTLHVFPPIYGMRWLVDGKVRRVCSRIGNL